MADFNEFMGRPKMDATSAVVLGIRLIKAAPKKRSAALNEALEEVRAGTLQVQTVRKTRHRLRPESLRPLDRRFDAGWGGLYDLLSGLARFEGEDLAARASRVLAQIFPDGAEFLTRSYDAEGLHGKTLLERIDEEELGPEIGALTNEVVLPYIRSAHAALGEGLGLGESEQETASTTAMTDALDVLAEAVSDYVRILAGETKKKDAASMARFQKAVIGPLERHREYHGRQRTARADEEEITEPAIGDEDPDAPIPPVAPAEA
jgi:hypothetical protein